MTGILESIPAGALIALDTMAWIYEFEAHPRFGPVTHALFTELIGTGRNPAGTSLLVLGELLVRPLALGRNDLAAEYRRIVKSGAGLSVWDVTREVVEKAADLRARHRLKMLDALHVASAIVNGAEVFVTNDAGLNRVDEITLLILDHYASPESSEFT